MVFTACSEDIPGGYENNAAVVVVNDGYIHSRGVGDLPEITDASQLLVALRQQGSGTRIMKMSMAELKHLLVSSEFRQKLPASVKVYYQKNFGNIVRGNMGYILEPNQMFKHPDELLCAECEVREGMDKIVLNFRPMLHLLHIFVDSNKKMDIRLRSSSRAVLNLEKGELKVVKNVPEKHFYPQKKYMRDFYFYVFPDKDILRQYGRDWIELTVTEEGEVKHIPVELKGLENGLSLLPGHSLTVNVTVSDDGKRLSVDPKIYANTTQWVYGITPPTASDWQIVMNNGSSANSKIGKMVRWRPGLRWYDCNKVYPYMPDQNNPDHDLCWAASTANMIHWWMEQNRDMISKYPYKGPSFAINMSDPLWLSDIYKVFTEKFSNMGGYEQVGYFWFFNNKEEDRFAVKNYDIKGGFFNDVFSPDFSLLEATTIESQEVLDEFMAESFKQRRAMTFTIKWPDGVGTMHIQSIWGADFDSEGHVTAIYITNSEDTKEWYFRDTRGRDQRYAMFKRELKRDEKGRVYYIEPTFSPDKEVYILRLASLDLGRRYWEQYFECKGN